MTPIFTNPVTESTLATVHMNMLDIHNQYSSLIKNKVVFAGKLMELGHNINGDKLQKDEYGTFSHGKPRLRLKTKD